MTHGTAGGRARCFRRAAAFVLAGLLARTALAPGQNGAGFPFSARVERLANGLTVVCVPLPRPNIISYSTIIRAGSRNEIEAGKSGYARVLARLTAEGTPKTPRTAYQEFLARLGAVTSGAASADRTEFTIVFSGRANLEAVVRIEADRIINFTYTADALRREAAVLEAESQAAAADPGLRLDERLRETAFEYHPYKQAAPGSLKDIRDMPNQLAYSRLFKKRYYAPDNAVLLVVGDFDPARLLTWVQRHYGAWEKSNFALIPPAEPPQTGPRRIHYPWPSRTPARLALGFHGPAFSDTAIDKAALDLLAGVAFSPSSPIVERLVDRERKCLSLEADFEDTRDPALLVFRAVVKKDEDLPLVERAILMEIERLKIELLPEQALSDFKKKLVYSRAAALETTAGVAGTLSPGLGLTGDPGALDRLHRLTQGLAPAQIREAARKYFQTENSTIVTLAAGGGR